MSWPPVFRVAVMELWAAFGLPFECGSSKTAGAEGDFADRLIVSGRPAQMVCPEQDFGCDAAALLIQVAVGANRAILIRVLT